jgi:hypothetical protein
VWCLDSLGSEASFVRLRGPFICDMSLHRFIRPICFPLLLTTPLLFQVRLISERACSKQTLSALKLDCKTEVSVSDKLATVDEWRKEMGLCWKEVAYLGGSSEALLTLSEVTRREGS